MIRMLIPTLGDAVAIAAWLTCLALYRRARSAHLHLHDPQETR